MGKKKSFINKKTATTYSLVYRSQEDAESAGPNASDRILAPAGTAGLPDPAAGGSVGEDGGRWPAGHPLAWLAAEANNRVSDDARRRDIVSLGLPDDGYDYLKHLRVIGEASKGSLEQYPSSASAAAAGGKGGHRRTEGFGLKEDGEEAALPGPGVFVPAPRAERKAVKDVKAVDATKLVLRSKAEDDGEAEELASGVTALTKTVKKVPRSEREELQEIAAAMAALEEVEDEDAFDAEAMDDEFVLQATELPGGEGDVSEEDEEEGEEVSSGIESGDEEGSEDGGIRGYPGYKGDGASLASSYWRKERTDRNAGLSLIDERFEQLAFQYDEDQIGELDDEEEDMAGVSDIGKFDGILDEFIEKHKRLIPGSSGDPEKDEARMASEKAKELAKAFEDEMVPEIPTYADDKPVERWDCESVLSLRSNLDNHPGRIAEPKRNPRKGAGDGRIRLSRKTGLPICVEEASSSGSEGDQSEAVSVATTIRRKDESAEEKKARKAAVKEAQRQARMRKKELKGMYKEQSSKMKNITTTRSVVQLT